jgi:transcriptional regulator with XRE-family HTH domain
MLVPKIKDMRKKAGLTQEQLSKLANISISHISDLETGKKYASAPTLWVLADVLKCLVDDLYETAE